MIPSEPHFCPTVTEALRDLAAGSLQPVELLEQCLKRIRAREDAVGAWQLLDGVHKAEPGASGPLAGLPVGIKDVIDTADMPTEYGSPAFAGHRPAADAVCVTKLRRAGARILGKTVTTEFASFHPGKTRNPHNRACTPGGSSSGSAAAVADGMVPVALGTQTAGSVIRPAAYCGVVGYKGTFGWSDMTGVHPLAPALDTLGLFARRVVDLAPVRGVLAEGQARNQSVARRPQVGICRTPSWRLADPATHALTEEVAAKLRADGLQLREVILPPHWDDLVEVQKSVMLPEMAETFAPIRAKHRGQISAAFLAQMEQGERISRERRQAAHAMAERCRADLDMLLPPGDVWLTPSAPGEAPPGTATGDPMFNRMWTLLGTPCITLPAGKGPRGLPLGVQLVAAPGSDDDLLDAALWLEEILARG
jgi:Asp-tRNA(Asn)/Glu-tRNA(Gln) amidotransferase A subunit family amidase